MLASRGCCLGIGNTMPRRACWASRRRHGATCSGFLQPVSAGYDMTTVATGDPARID